MTTKQLACAADAAINGVAGAVIPGYAAAKALVSFAGFSFNPIGALTGTNGLFSGLSPTVPQVAAGVTGANYAYQEASFAAAGGKPAP